MEIQVLNRGCIVCDAEDERNATPGTRPKKRFYSEHARDVALERLMSGEAYREHEEKRQEFLDAIAAGINPREINGRPSSFADDDDEPQRYDDGFEYAEEDFAW